MKYLEMFFYEFCISFSLTILLMTTSNTSINSSTIFDVALWMAAIICYQNILLFFIELRHLSYWQQSVIILGYIGGIIVFLTVGILIGMIEFNFINVGIYILIHTIIIALEYFKEERQIKLINEKLRNK